jgi:hypothetical protein
MADRMAPVGRRPNTDGMKRLFPIWLLLLSLSGLAFASDWKREVNGPANY